MFSATVELLKFSDSIVDLTTEKVDSQAKQFHWIALKKASPANGPRMQMIKIRILLLYGELVWVSEINRVRSSLFNWSTNKDQQRLPEPCGLVVTMTEKLFVPLHEHPDVSFIHFCKFSWLLFHRPVFNGRYR